MLAVGISTPSSSSALFLGFESSDQSLVAQRLPKAHLQSMGHLALCFASPMRCRSHTLTCLATWRMPRSSCYLTEATLSPSPLPPRFEAHDQRGSVQHWTSQTTLQTHGNGEKSWKRVLLSQGTRCKRGSSRTLRSGMPRTRWDNSSFSCWTREKQIRRTQPSEWKLRRRSRGRMTRRPLRSRLSTSTSSRRWPRNRSQASTFTSSR